MICYAFSEPGSVMPTRFRDARGPCDCTPHDSRPGRPFLREQLPGSREIREQRILNNFQQIEKTSRLVVNNSRQVGKFLTRLPAMVHPPVHMFPKTCILSTQSPQVSKLGYTFHSGVSHGRKEA